MAPNDQVADLTSKIKAKQTSLDKQYEKLNDLRAKMDALEQTIAEGPTAIDADTAAHEGMERMLEAAEAAVAVSLSEAFKPGDLDQSPSFSVLRDWFEHCYPDALEMVQTRRWEALVPKKIADQLMAWRTHTNGPIRFKKHAKATRQCDIAEHEKQSARDAIKDLVQQDKLYIAEDLEQLVHMVELQGEDVNVEDLPSM